jgi:hypothetical protein
VTSRLEDLADDYAGRNDTEVVEVTARSSSATAVIGVDDPNAWLRLQRNYDPLLFGSP